MTNSGVYIKTLTNQQACDSLATLNLTINYSSANTINTTVCDSYLFNGVTYTTSGTYIWTGLNILSCDSVVTLNLTVNNSISSSEVITACDSYFWNGVSYYSSGIYIKILTNQYGCDSLLALDLNINYSDSSFLSQISCGEYIWEQVSYDSSGVFIKSLTNEYGCDSIVTLDLTIISNSNSYIYQSGDSLYSSIISSPLIITSDWYNIHPSTGEYWLMKTNSDFFIPKFDCHYFIVSESQNGCIDTSATYYYGQFAKEIQILEIKPNPTRGKIKVNFNNDRGQFVRLRLVNNLGNLIKEYTSKQMQMNIDIGAYPSGIYYLFFTSGKETLTTKIILNK